MQHFYNFLRKSILVLLAVTGMQRAYAQAPSITTQPSNSTICAGGNTSFSVIASGTGLSYQWQVDQGIGFSNVSGSAFSGATSATLSITGATTVMNNDVYRCIVSNGSGADTSNSATLTVNALPQVLADPSPVTICAGGNAKFYIYATGTGISYQWQVNTGSGFTNISAGAPYSGETTDTLTITSASGTLNGYQYQCVVSGTCTPAAISNSATLTVNTSPVITTSPSSTSVCAGGNTSFTVAATGTSLTYQWQVNTGSGFVNIPTGAPYSGSTSATLSITGATAGMNGYSYQCIVSGSCSPASTSASATLTVNGLPSITTQPSDAAVCAGGNTSFSVGASGAGLTYQWQVNPGTGYVNVTAAGPYSGPTTNTLSISGAIAAMNGFTYRCIVSGTCTPAATSNSVTLTINAAPSITTQPVSANACPGGNDTFSVVATGAWLTYQWQVNTGSGWTNLSASATYSGVTTTTLIASGVTPSMAGYQYRVIVSGTCLPPATSNSATLGLNSVPSITGNPTSVTICQNGNTSFSASATGTGIAYQWQVNTGSGYTNITNTAPYSGATTNTLTITAAPLSLNGATYQCVVTGTCGTATTTAATLNINGLPAVSTSPANVAICPGSNTTFTVAATGAGLSYQWQVNTGAGFSNVPASLPYSGVTTNTLTITGATSGMNGYQYRAVVSGTCTPAANSASATLTIDTLPSIASNPNNDTVCPGTNANFTITASGTGLTYQWQVNTGSGWANVPASAPYNGTATASLTITGATAGMDGYQYRCMVSGTCAPSVTSSAATLHLNTQPSISAISTGTTACAGSNATISVAASGTGLIYQWQVNTGAGFTNVPASAPYSSTTTATLTITGVTVSMNGYMYRCIVSGTCTPSAISGSDTLKVNTAPVMTSFPTAPIAVCAGSSTSISATASGAGLTYQWQVDNGSGFANIPASAPYSGTTTNRLTISPVTGSMNGYMYRIVVNGTCSPATASGTVSLVVNTPPSITTQPTSSIACAGSVTAFYTGATGTGLTYQWQMNTGAGWSNVPASSPYSGTTTNFMFITSVASGMDSYQFRCIVSGTCTPTVTSNVVTLTVHTAPVVTTQPVNATLCAGGDTSFRIAATGAALTYQWEVNTGSGWINVTNGGIYSGATTNHLILTGTTGAMNGYQYRCAVAGSCPPSTISNAATLNVNTSPAISIQPGSTTSCTNGNPVFAVSATGTGLTYQWQENRGAGFINLTNTPPYSGVNTSALTISSINMSYNGYRYRVIISGTCAPSITSNIAILTVTNSTSWTGVISSAWSDPGNWACNTVPSATTNVTIPVSAPNMPLVDIPTAICDSMTIDAGANVAFSGVFNQLEIKGSIINNGTFDASQGKVNFSGAGQQLVPSSTYYDLQLSQAGDKVITNGNIRILDNLELDNGYLVLGDRSMYISPLATMTGGNSTSYMLTNGLGKVVNENVGPGLKGGDIMVPVGALRNSYTPLTINNSGTPDTFAVWVYAAVYQYYFNDIPTTATWNTDAVGRSWIVEENTPGGSNVILTLQWNASDELPGFDRNNCFMSHYTNTWHPGVKGAANGSGPYYVSMSGISKFSPFGVGSFGSPLPVHNVAKGSAEIKVYPNPVSGAELYVQFISSSSNNMDIRVMDVLGKQWNMQHVDMTKVKGTVVPVSVNDLAPGVYLLELTDADGTMLNTVRFVKQ